LSLLPGSAPIDAPRDFVIKVHNTDRTAKVRFSGVPLEVTL
jgi:hypothetical protein